MSMTQSQNLDARGVNQDEMVRGGTWFYVFGMDSLEIWQ